MAEWPRESVSNRHKITQYDCINMQSQVSSYYIKLRLIHARQRCLKKTGDWWKPFHEKFLHHCTVVNNFHRKDPSISHRFLQLFALSSPPPAHSPPSVCRLQLFPYRVPLLFPPLPPPLSLSLSLSFPVSAALFTVHDSGIERGRSARCARVPVPFLVRRSFMIPSTYLPATADSGRHSTERTG